MKFEPKVISKNNKLYRLSDDKELSLLKLNVIDAGNASVETPVASDKETVTAVKITWKQVELSDGNYNEELLAALRDFLKKLEEAGQFAFILPDAEKSFDDADQADSFIKAMVHAARRIKDAESVVGFAIAGALLEKDKGSSLDENSWTQWFVNEMNVKHGHYVYFADSNEIQNNDLGAIISNTDYILY